MACVKTSPEEEREISAILTHNELIKLGSQMNQENKKDELRSEINDILDENIEIFDVRSFILEFETLNSEDRKLKVFEVIKQNSLLVKSLERKNQKLKKLEDQKKELESDIDYHQCEEDKYLKELEESERKYKDSEENFKESEKYWTDRTQKLLFQCKIKNHKIKMLCLGLIVSNLFTNMFTYYFF